MSPARGAAVLGHTPIPLAPLATFATTQLVGNATDRTANRAHVDLLRDVGLPVTRQVELRRLHVAREVRKSELRVPRRRHC